MSEPQRRIVLLRLKAPVPSGADNFFVSRIVQKALIQEVTTAEEASKVFNGDSDERPAVYALDNALTQPDFEEQCEEANNYIQSGGVVVFGSNFATSITSAEAQVFFSKFGLPWQYGVQKPETFVLNPSVEHLDPVWLPHQYTGEAVSLRFVDRRHAIYTTSHRTVTSAPAPEGAIFAMDPPEIECEHAVAAIAKVGAGKVGYIGAFGTGARSEGVVLAMLGLN